MNDFTRRGFLGVLTAATAWLPFCRKAEAKSDGFKLSEKSKRQVAGTVVESPQLRMEFWEGQVPQSCECPDVGKLLSWSSLEFGKYLIHNGHHRQTYIYRDENADATGYVGYCRIKDSHGNVVCQATVGRPGSGAGFLMGSTAIVAGQPIDFSFAFTVNDGRMDFLSIVSTFQGS